MMVFKRIKEIAERLDVASDRVLRIISFLQEFGYLPKNLTEMEPETFKTAIEGLQRQYGYSVSGEIDAKTLNIVELPRCGCPDFLNENAGGVNKWGVSTLYYYVRRRDSDLSTQVWDDTIAAAWYEWEKICGLTFKRTDTESKAHLISDVGSGRGNNFDGPGRVLAWHQLPPSSNYQGQLLGMADSAETWTEKFLKGVWVHEGGHGLGFSHSNDRNDIMYPTYNGVFTGPQAGDIRRAVDYYGNPIAQPDPEEPTDPKGWEKFTLELEVRGFKNINIPGYRVIRQS